MSTRFTKSETDGVSIPTGYEGNNVPADFSVPPCTIEDVDRALFNLFNEDIPLMYQQRNETKKIPVIFATGERFAVLRRKRPLRDNQGALILPLISLMRTSIEQDPSQGVGPGQNAPLVIKKRLDKKDVRYQDIINKLNLLNQSNVASENHRLGTGQDRTVDLNRLPTGAAPGEVATRRASPSVSTAIRQGKLLTPEIGNNIFEIITMPPIKYFTATYDITFWAQYTVQMNDMITAMMSSYQNNHRRTFRIETDKGYWFVAYISSAISPGDNFDNFTDEERVVRYSFTVEVPGYVVLSDFPGAPSGLRSFVSAPQISFGTSGVGAAVNAVSKGGLPSGQPDSYILQDMVLEDSSIPGSGVGTSAAASAMMAVGGENPGAAIATADDRSIQDRRGGTAGVDAPKSANVGGYTGGTDKVGESFVAFEENPLTGEKTEVLYRVKSRVQRKGETVLKPEITRDLGNID